MKDFLNGRKLLKGEGSLASKKKSASEITKIPVRLMESLNEKKKLLEFVKGMEDPTDQTVLVWYQGNLHLLRRRPSAFPNENLWYPLTAIGHEIRNAPLIARFVNKSFPKIDAFTRKMKQFRTSFVRNESPRNEEIDIIKTTNQEDYYRKLRAFVNRPTYVSKPGFRTRRIMYNRRNRDASLASKDCPNCPPRYYQYTKDKFFDFLELETIVVPNQSNTGIPTAKFTEINGFGQLCSPSD
ncbi:BgTH12-06102 [Blumeria graminis f. sp. triticale]|uniref:BgTH12-06102 n=1 Tax=Blumeria graminis f. sp. triticale TaxID=1689686 RepID=A0A9W4DQ80_BLUGR|nr:BgTH12-06102 [Blumeria graminis f. sp. triticale]